MRTYLDSITRRDALKAIGGAAVAGATSGRRATADDDKRPPARIYVSVLNRTGEFPQELTGVLAIDPKDGTWTQVLREQYYVPRVSYDGRRILCSRLDTPARRGLYVCDARGEEPPKRVVDEAIRYYCWSSDGEEIFYGSRRADGTLEGVKIRADGTGRAGVPIPATDFVLACSADGRWLATSSSRGLKAPDVPSFGRQSVYAVHPDGTGERLLLDAGPSRVVGDFSPDGRELMFITYDLDENGTLRSSRLGLIGLDGRNRRTFLAARGREYPIRAAWSPDGKELVVLYREDRIEPGEALTVDKITMRLEIVSADAKQSRRLDILDGVRFNLGDWL